MNMRTLSWFFAYSGAYLLAWLAFFHASGPALRVLGFLAGVLFVLSLPSICSAKMLENIAGRAADRPARPTWLRRLDLVADLGMVTCLVWFGHVLLGLAWLSHMLAGAVIEEKADDIRQEQKNAVEAHAKADPAT